VNRALSLNYSDLLSFPMVSEVANLKCVAGKPDVTYNWTGIPLFYLLTLAQIEPEAYKVAIRGSDGFSSDLLVADALKPTTILALGADGGSLPEINGIRGLFRLVVPGKWGYKWVGYVDEIEVVDYNYLGTYEAIGYSDAAQASNSPVIPSITPPIQDLNFALGNRTFNVEAFANVSINAHTFDYLQKEVGLSVTVPSGSSGLAVFILQQDFLRGPYNLTMDGQGVNVTEADVAKQSYLYALFPEGSHTVKIAGSETFASYPEIAVNYNETVGTSDIAIFDASQSSDYGRIVAYEWNFGDGNTATGPVVSHSYAKEGTYQVELNVTNNNYFSSSATFTVTVANPKDAVPFFAKAVLVATLGLLAVMFVFLVKRSRSFKVVASNGF
jgi:hypothetical protein